MAHAQTRTMAKRGQPPVVRERILALIRKHGAASPSGIEKATAEDPEGQISRQSAHQSMKAAVKDGKLRRLPLARAYEIVPESKPD